LILIDRIFGDNAPATHDADSGIASNVYGEDRTCDKPAAALRHHLPRGYRQSMHLMRLVSPTEDVSDGFLMGGYEGGGHGNFLSWG
jgi:hypothetical protein